MYKQVFSEYELLEVGFKFENGENHKTTECVGSCEDSAEVKVVTKKCRGVVKKKKVKGTGTGTLKLSLHCPWDVWVEMYGMQSEELETGVYGYGQNSHHETFSLTQRVEDEDGNQKLKAYPNCIVETGKSTKIENGAEEVAEVELEISYSPDEYGYGVYEAITSEVTKEEIKTKWMTAFEPKMAHVAEG